MWLFPQPSPESLGIFNWNDDDDAGVAFVLCSACVAVPTRHAHTRSHTEAGPRGVHKGGSTVSPFSFLLSPPPPPPAFCLLFTHSNGRATYGALTQGRKRRGFFVRTPMSLILAGRTIDRRRCQPRPRAPLGSSARHQQTMDGSASATRGLPAYLVHLRKGCCGWVVRSEACSLERANEGAGLRHGATTLIGSSAATRRTHNGPRGVDGRALQSRCTGITADDDRPHGALPGEHSALEKREFSAYFVRYSHIRDNI